MPPTPGTATLSALPTRRQVTGVLAVYDAGSLYPCRAGEKVALHILTREGEIIVRCSERAFVLGCRGQADANGNPFRSIEDLDAGHRARREGIDAPPPAEVPAAPPPEDGAFPKAWAHYLADPRQTLRTAARSAAASFTGFSRWVRFHHAEEAREIRRTRWGSYRTRRLNA